MTRRGASGFTLVELMAAMAVVLLLVALLLPAVARARQAAGRVQCLSGLRQLGIALAAYAAQHDDLLPHEDDGDSLPPFGCGWYEVLDATLGDRRCLQCPGLTVDPSWRSYKMNALLEEGPVHFLSLSSVENPSRTVLAFDGRIDNAGVRRQPKGDWDMAASRHGSGTSVLFCDGRVQWVKGRFDTAGWQDAGGLAWRP